MTRTRSRGVKTRLEAANAPPGSELQVWAGQGPLNDLLLFYTPLTGYSDKIM